MSTIKRGDNVMLLDIPADISDESFRLGNGSKPLSFSSGLVILKLQNILNMRSILNIKNPPKHTLFNNRKTQIQHIIHNPKPNRAKKNAQSSSSKNLSHSMVSQVNPRIHSKKRKRPREEVQDHVTLRKKEERPTVRVTGLEEDTGVGASLMNCGFDDFVDKLRDYEADEEEDTLEFAAEDEVGDEAAEADEDWD
ncbi:hypothetical protein Lal_00037698 [Lupinus albus]|nr:hypothetical protein Lal_00037698 [Lupinus albus]